MFHAPKRRTRNPFAFFLPSLHSQIKCTLLIQLLGCVPLGGRGDSGTLRSAKSEESLTSLHAVDGKTKPAPALLTLVD